MGVWEIVRRRRINLMWKPQTAKESLFPGFSLFKTQNGRTRDRTLVPWFISARAAFSGFLEKPAKVISLLSSSHSSNSRFV
ncbi:MAG: hypothetical protein A2934_05430 [Candidatus Sungbacteria bacterium RIFCSPLOWO2_01_FULL_47_10]|uniref:Uncharacterized protein n=1 Tax=Candidatus Sungbacteria bacterium RIFCSPLOWO2_01_FULL_47_10 TaxID=1802276 RepID=A0A1G2L1G1_9BACT|nr:MAG: hypothetical protein A2934_05430 [Candidatus Sungbacteria bacterium RIFCSPLOWO2_01_FULL_47_10]